MRRLLLLLLGVGCLSAAWFSPATQWLPGPFSRHMSIHMAVVGLAAPLLTFAVAGTRWDPVRYAERWFSPVLLSVVELVVVWAWHAPGLHDWASRTQSGWITEQTTFLLSGLLVWLSAFGGAREQRSTRAGAGVVALLLTSMHMTLLGALLALPPRPLYARLHSAHVAAHSHTSPVAQPVNAHEPLQDQHWGGAIMLVVGGVVYLGGGLALMAQLLIARSTAPRAEPRALRKALAPGAGES